MYNIWICIHLGQPKLGVISQPNIQQTNPSTKNHGEIGKTQSISYHLDLFHYRPLWKCARKKGACL